MALIKTFGESFSGRHDFPGRFRRFASLLLSACSLYSACLFANEEIVYSEKGRRITVEGRLLFEFPTDLILMARDGRIHRIAVKDISHRVDNEKEFVPVSQKELEEQLAGEFPKSAGFNILSRSKRYTIVYATSRAYAEWCQRLFDQLYDSYLRFWKQRGIPLDKHEFPLVAIIFANPGDFNRYALRDIGGGGMAAYYNKMTNRIVLCNLEGIETFLADQTRRATASQIDAFLERPLAAFNIATIIHEATHQVGFNCGMHERIGVMPLWICEGLAMLHEVPNRDAKNGWNITLKTNHYRLEHIAKYNPHPADKPLEKMIRDDALFSRPDKDVVLSNYALAWGLTYYLAKRKEKDLSRYLIKVGNKSVLSPDTPEERMKDFEECFGTDWESLYKDLFKYLQSLRR